jgi:hypothetical protein
MRRPLWDSYDFAIIPVSKTYARGGTSARSKVPLEPKEMRCASLPELRPGPPRKCCSREGDATRNKPMMDILMLALGFAFFALAIGYTYACERL